MTDSGQVDRPAGSRTAAFVSGPRFLDHWAGLGHPESPQRLAAIWEGLYDAGLWDRLVHVEPRAATVEDLLRVHHGGYVDLVRSEVEAGHRLLSTGDVNLCPQSYEVALLAAGAGLAAVDAVVAGRAGSAFCGVRPPGHHATASSGMGFCIFNNVAVAARYAQAAWGVGRVLIADWDVHQGNGTQTIFYRDPTVVYFSIHLAGHYPMQFSDTGRAEQAGEGPGEGTTLNCPLPRGAGNEEVLAAFTERLAPAMAEFRPELVIVSAGFDSCRGDPLGGMEITPDGFAALTRVLMDIADASAGGRIVSLLEGGYVLEALASNVVAHVRALMGE